MDDTRIQSARGAQINQRTQETRPAHAVTSGEGDNDVTTRVTGSSSAPPIDLGSIGKELLQSLADLLPTQVLSSPDLRKAEGAWRQLLLQRLFKDPSPPEAGQSGQFHQALVPSADSTQLAQSTMRSWWAALENWIGEAKQGASLKRWEGALPNTSLVPFAALSRHHLQGILRSQQREVLIDRILSSIAADNSVRVGSGLFIPSRNHQGEHRSRGVSAVRWNAQRQRRMNRHGQLVHRLEIQFQIQEWPVEITFLSAKPSLQVHIRTNHPLLLKAASVPEQAVRERLADVGWQLDNWSLHDLSESEE